MVGEFTPVPTFSTSIMVCGLRPNFCPVTRLSLSAQMLLAMM
jgi:hypothetical protein